MIFWKNRKHRQMQIATTFLWPSFVQKCLNMSEHSMIFRTNRNKHKNIIFLSQNRPNSTYVDIVFAISTCPGSFKTLFWSSRSNKNEKLILSVLSTYLYLYWNALSWKKQCLRYMCVLFLFVLLFCCAVLHISYIILYYIIYIYII